MPTTGQQPMLVKAAEIIINSKLSLGLRILPPNCMPDTHIDSRLALTLAKPRDQYRLVTPSMFGKPRSLIVSSIVTALVLLSLGLGGCSKSSNTESESAGKAPVQTIGIATFVDHIVLNTVRDGFLDELKSAGYTQAGGWNIAILNANGSPAEATAVATELLNLRPRLLVSFTTPATKPLFEKNQGRYPLVYSFVSFPEQIGITEGSPNVTGLSDGVDFQLLLDLIKETIPGIQRIGIVASDEPNAQVSHDRLQVLAKASGIQLSSQIISKEEEVRSAAEAILKQPNNRRPQAIVVGADGIVTNKITALLDVANARKVPVFAVDESSVGKGAVAGLSVNYADFGRETARVAIRILKGKKPDDIPMNRFLAKDILVNEKAAVSIGLSIPPATLKRAVKVIR